MVRTKPPRRRARARHNRVLGRQLSNMDLYRTPDSPEASSTSLSVSSSPKFKYPRLQPGPSSNASPSAGAACAFLADGGDDAAHQSFSALSDSKCGLSIVQTSSPYRGFSISPVSCTEPAACGYLTLAGTDSVPPESPTAAEDRDGMQTGTTPHVFATGISIVFTSPVLPQLPSMTSLFSASAGTPAHAPAPVQKRGEYRRALWSDRVAKSNEAWEVMSQPMMTARTGNYFINTEEVFFVLLYSYFVWNFFLFLKNRSCVCQKIDHLHMFVIGNAYLMAEFLTPPSSPFSPS
jgi:hypothetical protein